MARLTRSLHDSATGRYRSLPVATGRYRSRRMDAIHDWRLAYCMEVTGLTTYYPPIYLQVRALLASSRELALEVFISRHLVGFLRQALERVGRVFQVSR